METLTKQQKQQVEKAEGSQTVDLKNAAKKIKMEQVGKMQIYLDIQTSQPADSSIFEFGWVSSLSGFFLQPILTWKSVKWS